MADVQITVDANATAADRAFGSVEKSAERMGQTTVQVAGTTEAAFDEAARSTGTFGAALDKTAGFTDAAAGGLEGLQQTIDSVGEVMNHADNRANAFARAQLDVEQASNDMKQAVEDANQAVLDASQADQDGEQASLDLAQAQFDVAEAQKEYNKALKEHGANSAEAKQAALDLRQANLDVTQAEEDKRQALADSNQASIDSKQALIDQKDATITLSESTMELGKQSGVMGTISSYAGVLSGVLSGLVGIVGLVTAAQWLWNVAMSANPIGLVVAAVLVVIGVIVFLATKTQFFQTIWKGVWDYVVQPVRKAWNWLRDSTVKIFDSVSNKWKKLPGVLKTAFDKLKDIITAPFRAGFAAVKAAWNSTVGGFGFSVPDWVPGVGGNSFRIPSMAVGGDVLKGGLAFLHRGERVSTAGAVAQRVAYERRTSRQPDISHGQNIIVEITTPLSDPMTVAMVDLLQNNVRVKKALNSSIRDHVRNTANGSAQLAYGRKGMS